MSSQAVEKVVVRADLARWADAALQLHDHLGAEGVMRLDQQIRHLIRRAIEDVGVPAEEALVKSTGDGAFLFFDDAATASLFAEALHRQAAAASADKATLAAQRHFRIGIASGELVVNAPRSSAGSDLAGRPIVYATRLENACRAGEVLISSDVWRALPEEMRRLYGPAEVIRGKGQERFDAHRRKVLDPAPWERPSPEPGSAARGIEPPVKITHLEIENLRVLDHLAVELNPGEEDAGQWILLLGDNGVGKTTILRMVALACVEEQTAAAVLEWLGNSAPLIRHDATAARTSISLSTGEIRFSIHRNATSERMVRERYPEVTPGPVFAYGCQRGTALGGPDRQVEFKAVDNIRPLFDDHAHLIHGETWMKNLRLAAHGGGRDEAFFDAVCTTLAATLPGVDAIDLNPNGQLWFHGPKVDRAPLAAMSDGYVTTVGWIIDLIGRWADRSRRLGLELDGDFRDKMTGIVLIDEIDLHLHPQWQVEIVSILRAQLPRLSFMATTHNPLTLLGARPGEVQVLRREPESNRVVVHQVDVAPGLRTDQVLTGPWFGLSSTVDQETRQLLARHREMLRERVPRNDPRRRALEAELRERSGTFAETSVERLVHSVAAELIVEELEEQSPERRQALRDKVLAEARNRKQNAAA